MNTELQKIHTILNARGFPLKTFLELSKNRVGVPLVNDLGTAYSFDNISDSFYYNQHSSCDCLLLRDNLYLIEFKRLAYTEDSNKYKIIKQNLAMKISESLHTLEKKIFNVCKVDASKFEKVFIVVVDSVLSPIPAMIGVMANLGNISPMSSSTSIHNDGSLLQCLSKYGNKDKNNDCTYFNKIKLINDINFSAEISFLT